MPGRSEQFRRCATCRLLYRWKGQRGYREDKGYTNWPFSWLSTRNRDAYWGQRADVTAEHTAASLREIYAEFDLLRESAPGQAELARVQNYMTGIFTISNASRGGILNQIAFIDAHGLPPEYLTAYVERISAITPKQVSATARDHLVPERMSLAIVGDLELVRPKLETLPRLHGRLQ